MFGLRLAITIAGLSHLSSMVAGLVLMFVPLLSGTEVAETNSGFTQITVVKQTILETKNPNVLIMLTFPWIVTGIAVFSAIMADPRRGDQQTIRWRWKSYGWACTIVLTIFIVLSVASVGWFYVPALLLSVLSCALNK